MTRSAARGGAPWLSTTDAAAGSRTSRPALVVAAAGYGRSTWVDLHAASPDALHVGAEDADRELLAQARDRDLVIEELHRLTDADQVALMGRLTGRSTDRTLVLTSREPLADKARALLPGPVLEVGPVDLALSTAEVAGLLTEEYGLADPELPSRVHAATAGWPTLVHLAADSLARRPREDLLTALGSPGTSAATWLESEVLTTLPEEAVDLLRALSSVDLVTRDLAVWVAGEDLPASTVTAAVDLLVRAGLLVPHPRGELLGLAWHRVVPALARLLLADERDSAHERRRLRRAATWYEAHDVPFAAVDAYERVGDRVAADGLVTAAGQRMIVQGDAAGIVVHLATRPDDELDDGLRRTLGEALNTSGQPYAALTAFAPLVRAADRDGWDASLAVRVAAVHFSQGDLALARDVLDRVPVATLPDGPDAIACRAARVNVLSLLGEDQEAAALARATLGLAQQSGTPTDLTAAHQAVAKTSSGSRKAVHLGLALTAARQARDVVSMARILGNQAYGLLAAARCVEAVDVARLAVRAAELVRPMGALTVALHNLAEALTRVGDYDEARWHLRRAASVSQRLGPHRAAASLCGLGDVHRALGRREQGRAVYEEAVQLARASGELQVLVPALAGLARLVLEVSPDEARAAAEEALRLTTPSLAPYALIALGWVEAVAGDRSRSAELAEQALTRARADQSVDLVAEALELAAASTDDPERARAALEEAASIWREGGAGPDTWRLEVLLARLEGADRDTRARGREAAERLQRLGVSAVGGRPPGADPMGKDVTIAVLGRFEVEVAGRPVPLQVWKSRQARTLVKILAARRGHPASRALLCEHLWPDDDPIKTSHRLSVLLTTVRTVLDPARSWPFDHYVASDTRGVWLDLRRVGVDVDELLADAEQGASLLAAGELGGAATVLAAVDERYQGEAFEDEPDDDWARGVREEARAAWLRSLRHLATAATQQHRSNDASAILTRLLTVDPYDERVHRGLVRTLVRAGRHGEARRAFDRWTEAMRTIDAPFPDPTELTPHRPL